MPASGDGELMIASVQSIESPCGTVGFTRPGKRCLNVTNRRNLSLPALPESDPTHAEQIKALRLTREPSVAEILTAAGHPTVHEEIVFCGPGEPTLRLYEVLQAAAELRSSAAVIRLDTDGLANRVHGRDVTPDLEGLIDRLTVALNAHNAEFYEALFHPPYTGCFAEVLGFIECAREFVPQITLTADAELPGVDVAACARIAQDLGVHFAPRGVGMVC